MVAYEWRGFLSIEVQPCGNHVSHVGCPVDPSYFPCYVAVVHASLEISPKPLDDLGLQMGSKRPNCNLTRLSTSYSNKPNR